MMPTVKEFVEVMKQTALSDRTETELALRMKVFATWAGKTKEQVVNYLRNTDSSQTKIFQDGLLWLDHNGYGDLDVDEVIGRAK